MEWKQEHRDQLRDGLLPLKPSLVEWKLAKAGGSGLRVRPLKPSLVEWKLERGVHVTGTQEAP